MPSIVIREIDETSPSTAAASTDVVYVPGFCAKSSNFIVLSTKNQKPDAEEGLVNVTIATNIVDRKTWKYTAEGVWTPQAGYIAPPPENEPVLCQSVAEFEEYFGELPYQFTSIQTYPTAGYPQSSPAVTNIGNMYDIGDYDKSYIYAKDLLSLGIPVIYEAVVSRGTDGSVDKDNGTVANMYEALSGDIFTVLQDKSEYTVKYLTTGAYPVYEYSTNSIVTKMLNCAFQRGDCVALIDHTNNPGRALTGEGSVYDSISEVGGTYAITTNDEFGAMFTPWASYNSVSAPSDAMNQVMPASYGYLLGMAQSIVTNPNWLAIAGTTRGLVPNITSLNTTSRLTNAVADRYQPRNAASINAITNIKPYGLTIWGNRTLKNNADGNLTATSFLNIRNLVSDVKKVVYTAAKRCMFEQNSDILWINFKAMITPTLDRMNSGSGISGYKIIKGTTDEKAKLVATIRLYPIYAVEDFDITVIMSDEEVNVS